MSVKGGTVSPTVTVPLRAYGAGTKPGEKVGFNVTVTREGQARRERPAERRRSAATRPRRVRLTGFRPVKGKTYTVVRIEANVFSGGGVG